MIAIVNISKNPTKRGICTYEIRINERVITVFNHCRADGLAECLRKAGIAVDEQRMLDIERILNDTRRKS